MTDLSAERIARNDAIFRAANEKIAASAADYDLTGSVPFICECAEGECTEVILVDLDEYGAIRSNPRHFLNVPGHEATMLKAGAGTVVEDRGHYLLVEKTGVAGEIVEQLADIDDPSQIV